MGDIRTSIPTTRTSTRIRTAPPRDEPPGWPRTGPGASTAATTERRTCPRSADRGFARKASKSWEDRAQMEATLLKFAALLRAAGLRVSTGEVVDGMQAAAAVALRDRETLKLALGVTMVKDDQDWPVFSELYDRFFHLQPLSPPESGEHEHGHDE